MTTQGVQLGPKGELLSNILNTLESDVTTMEFEPKGELLSNNLNTRMHLSMNLLCTRWN